VNLRIPGPTPVPDSILAATAGEMINHRGPEFAALIGDVTPKLKRFFRTTGDLFVLTASGTGGLEAAIVNTLSPGDAVLAVSIGWFGERFAEIARRYGADVDPLEFPYGQAADPEIIRSRLAAREYKAVLVTHNETSTGVTNDLPAIAHVVRQTDALLLVDGVSSVGSLPIDTDGLGCDVVVSASQKGWMVPPGLAFTTVSERAWKAHATARMPRFYFDFTLAKKYLERGQTPTTPAISILFALAEALRLLEDEGPDEVYARHHRVAEYTRSGVKALGLELFPDESVASDTVTAVRVPEGVDGGKLLRLVAERHGVIIAGGQDTLAGKIFRIGHLGFVSEDDIRATLDALRAELPDVGFSPRAARVTPRV
jgi:aspartate aminotransferase-like enzyme